MSPVYFKHRDIEDYLAGLPGLRSLRFVVLVDRPVTAILDVGLLEPGSLEPLANTILETLACCGPLTLESLMAHLGFVDSFARQAVAEIVHILARTDDAFLAPQGDGTTIIRGRAERRPIGTKVTFRSDRVQFVPAAQYMHRTLHITPRDRLERFKRDNPVWECDWQELYESEVLKRDIKASYLTNFSSQPARGNSTGDRIEILQRSRLLPATHRLAFVEVEDVFEPDVVFFHRCYLYCEDKRRGSPWRVFVCSYRFGSVQNAYTRYLSARIKDADVLEALIDASVPVHSS